ncbi:MAG TPA: ADOP family duplicated permease [Gemmatimonadaceae bacterium]|nr:ADOP family duplicated permease [Gemmatimonadaceae bacterium]
MLADLWSALRYRVRALLAPGGVEQTKEDARDARGTLLLESIVQDLRFAARGLRARPAFTAGVVLTLGLGIGANVAMFGITDRLLLRPPAYLRDASLVHRAYMGWTSVAAGRDRLVAGTSYARYLDFRRWTHAFSSIATFATWNKAIGDGESVREMPVAGVSASYFDFFDARPAVGRFFSTAEDSVPMGSPVVVLSYSYWQLAFGGRADVLGQQVRINQTLCTVIGVAPPNFIGVPDERAPTMWIPITTFLWDARPRDYSNNYSWQGRYLIVKRKPEFSVAAATADLTAAFQRSWIAENAIAAPQDVRPIVRARPRAMLGPIQLERGPLAGPETKVITWVTGVAVIVLLIACANVANLLLARAVTRRREIALRLALGVSRGRLVGQLAIESLLLAALGGALGLGVAQWGGAAVRTLFLPGDAGTVVLSDQRTLVLTLVATLGAALLTGLAPAGQALRSDLARSLNAVGRDAGAHRSRVRMGLVLFQATLSVVLLIGAGLFVRSLVKVRGMHVGYDIDPVAVVTVNKRGVKLTEPEQIALDRRLADAANVTPGVVAATPVPTVPFWSYETRSLFVRGADSVERLGSFTLQAGNPDYFRTVGTRLVRGRAFTDADRANTPLVVVVSEGMARAVWPGTDAIGQCIRMNADTMPCMTVIGVAENVHMRSFSGEREFTYYIPIAQYARPAAMLLVRGATNAAEYVEPLRRQLQRVMPGAAYVTAVPFRTIVDPNMQSWRLGGTMFVAFGGLALALAAIGIYSVVAYGVAQRRQEIAVRIALGSPRARVVRLVMRGGLRLVGAGVVLGSLIAVGAGRQVAPLLFQESPTDPVVYLSVAAVLVVAALVATAMPAWRASRVDPNVALRAD